MTSYTSNYDPGFLNVPGFGQSATNPLAPVYYTSLGVVKDLSVYNSIYAANAIEANMAFKLGSNVLTQTGFKIDSPTDFSSPVNAETKLNAERLFVNGKEYVETTIVAENGTFRVLARV